MIKSVRASSQVVVGVVSIGHFFSHFYKLALPPLFPLLSDEFGLNNTQLGLIISVVAVGGLLQVPVGAIVDRVGAKWVFVAGVGVTAGGIILVGVGSTYPIILALAVITGLGQSAFHPADYALIEAVTEPDLQGRAFSVHTFSGYAGSAAAPVTVGSLAFATGWRITLFLVGGVGLLYALVSAVALDPTYQAAAGTDDNPSGSDIKMVRSFLVSLRRPGILAMFGFFLVFAFANRGIHTFTTVLAVNSFSLPESAGNTLLTVFFAAGSLGVLTGGVLADRLSPSRVISGTMAIGSGSILLTVSGVLPFEIPLLLCAFGLIGFFISLATPARDRLVSIQSSSGSMGVSFGVVFTGATIGALLGPVLLGAVGDFASITMSFVLVAILYLVAGLLTLFISNNWLVTDSKPTPADEDQTD